MCYSRTFQVESQPGRFGTHKSWESDSLRQLEAGVLEGPSPPRRRKVSGPEEAVPLAALIWMPTVGSCVVPTSQVSDRMEGFESRTKCPLSFPEEPYLFGGRQLDKIEMLILKCGLPLG